MTLEECYAAKEQIMPYEPNNTIQEQINPGDTDGVRVRFYQNCTAGAGAGFNPDNYALLVVRVAQRSPPGSCAARPFLWATSTASATSRAAAPPPPAIPNAGVGWVGSSTGCVDAAMARGRPTCASPSAATGPTG